MYVWQDGNPVQLAGNLSLPGGFQLGAFGSEYCDVVTATGKRFLWKVSFLDKFYLKWLLKLSCPSFFLKLKLKGRMIKKRKSVTKIPSILCAK